MDTDPKPETLIRYLYGEGPDPGLEADPALKAEYEALAGIKTMLDARAPDRPEPATLAAVLNAATPRRRAPIIALHRWQPLAAAAVLVVAFGMGIWMIQEPAAQLAPAARQEASAFADEAAPAAADQDEALAQAPMEAPQEVQEEKEREDAFRKMEQAPTSRLQSLDVLNEAEPTPGLASAATGRLEAPGKDKEPVPSWDEADDDLRALYWRVNALNMRSENMQWDEPIPLEQFPLDAGGKNRPLRVDMKR